MTTTLRTLGLYGLTALLLLLTAAPALGGSEDDPEVQGECERSSSGPSVRIGDEYEICLAWFNTVFNQDGDATGLTTTVKLGDDYEDRVTPGYVSVSWHAEDGCRETWSYADTISEGSSLTLYRACPGNDLVTHVLDSEQVDLDRDQVTATLWARDFAAIGGKLVNGTALSGPTARSQLLLRAPGHIVVDVAAAGSSAGPGRDYVVGSD